MEYFLHNREPCLRGQWAYSVGIPKIGSFTKVQKSELLFLANRLWARLKFFSFSEKLAHILFGLTLWLSRLPYNYWEMINEIVFAC